jgi:cyclic beta-1,2-glucan synthetase
LIGGLTLAKMTFPEMEGKIEAFLYSMSYKDTYDEYNGWIKGGYNITINDFAVFQPWGKWYYKFFASETRLLSFYGIARGAYPPEHWKALLRTKWRKGDYKILASGYEEGGLFTHYMTGLFLDERKMEMGKYQRYYALSQIKYGKKIEAPAWGWSSCETPKGRYLGYGELKDEIVAPYASILAAIYFPDSVYKNLKALEELGARKPLWIDGKETSWGFRDSVNWQTKDVSKNVLLLDQAMIFLTLANVLHDGVVWQTFQSDAHIQKGLEKIQAFEAPQPAGTEEATPEEKPQTEEKQEKEETVKEE